MAELNGNEEESEQQESQEETGEQTQNSEETTERKEYSRAEERAKRREQRKTEDVKDYQKLYEQAAKERVNERSLYDRQMNEIRSQQAELLKHKDMLQQIADMKNRAELENLKKTNPDEYQKKLMQNAIDERLNAQKNPQTQDAQTEAPLTDEQFNQWGIQAETYLKQDPEIGDKKYKAMEPLMIDVLKSASRENAAILLHNPKELFYLSVGKAYMSEMASQSQQTKQGVQQANKFHAGTARPSGNAKRSSSDYGNMSDKELEAAKNAAILQEYNLNK